MVKIIILFVQLTDFIIQIRILELNLSFSDLKPASAFNLVIKFFISGVAKLKTLWVDVW